MLTFLIGIIPLFLVIFILIIGFCIGFTTYAIFLKIAVSKGRAFVIDKNGEWQPFDPRQHSPKMLYGVKGDLGGDLKIMVDGQEVERWTGAENNG